MVERIDFWMIFAILYEKTERTINLKYQGGKSYIVYSVLVILVLFKLKLKLLQ